MAQRKKVATRGMKNVVPVRTRAPCKELQDKVVLVIHGGTGVRPKGEMTKVLQEQYESDLMRALRAGQQALNHGRTSVEAVEAAVRVLEDSPLFNAGKGSAFTREGRNELSASIMSGKEKRAGAVAGLTRIRNPISAARAVMERSEHVFLIGEGAERFALSEAVEEVSPVYFWTQERWDQLQDVIAQQDRTAVAARRQRGQGAYYHTVGAVALDRHGDLAAGTSTGGLAGQWPGRVGDSPIVGAGTYADNHTCAVSATGWGELFIRHTVAHDIAARMGYKGLSLQQATEEVFWVFPKQPGGVGGVIALDQGGRFVTHFDTEGMYRGYITGAGDAEVAIYKE